MIRREEKRGSMIFPSTTRRAKKILGFVPTKYPQRAKALYVEVLGLEFSSEDQFALELQAGGNRIRIAKTDDFEPMPFTILGWEVAGIDSIVAGLIDRGVVFEKYNGSEQNDVGIWNSPSGARVAWFKDTDGNLPSIFQHPNNYES
jgi:hypothetical protein